MEPKAVLKEMMVPPQRGGTIRIRKENWPRLLEQLYNRICRPVRGWWYVFKAPSQRIVSTLGRVIDAQG
jgi:hypothetical protein